MTGEIWVTFLIVKILGCGNGIVVKWVNDFVLRTCKLENRVKALCL